MICGFAPACADDAGREPKETRIEATFKCEDFDPEAKEAIGPLVLWDADDNEFYKEVGWMSKSEARETAAKNGWPFDEDCG